MAKQLSIALILYTVFTLGRFFTVPIVQCVPIPLLGEDAILPLLATSDSRMFYMQERATIVIIITNSPTVELPDKVHPES